MQYSRRYYLPLCCDRRSAARRGAIAVLIVFFLPVFLIMAGFAVNVAYMQLCRAELRVAGDAAARAGAGRSV